MLLSKKQKREIIKTAISYIGKPYSKEFDCIQFVRVVYEFVGIHIPKIPKLGSPPSEFNICKKQLNDIPVGHIVFLRDRHDPRKERSWTHVVIALNNRFCIHNSVFYGSKVVVSDFEKITKDRYDFAESIIPP